MTPSVIGSTMYQPLWSYPYPKSVVFKWVLMAFIAGNINAGGWMACQRFVTHVTGFATWFGIEAAMGEWQSALGMLSVPAFFLGGVMVSALLTDGAVALGRKPKFGLVMGLVASLLCLTSLGGYFQVFGLFGRTFDIQSDYIMLILLCTASGMQNAAITLASGGTMRSTHLTGTTTDLGIGIVRAFALDHDHEGLRSREIYRNSIRLAIIFGFVVGSVGGAILFMVTEYLGFLLPAALAVYVGNLGVRTQRQAA